jgi:hypothetical protein
VEKPGSLSQVPGPSGFSDRLSSLVVLDPEEGTAGPGVDRPLSPKTSVLMFHRKVEAEAAAKKERAAAEGAAKAAAEERQRFGL